MKYLAAIDLQRSGIGPFPSQTLAFPKLKTEQTNPLVSCCRYTTVEEINPLGGGMGVKLANAGYLAGFIAIFLAIGSVLPAAAQGLETELVISGRSLTCKDFRGAEVRTTRMNDLGDVARAWIVARIPIITIDTVRMAQLPVKAQLFFYFHECGHHVLAHIYIPTITSENEADCWAIKRGRAEGLFTRDDVLAFGPVFAHSRGSKAGHLPGPERVKHLLSCFDDPAETVEEPEAAQSMPPVRSLAGGG